MKNSYLILLALSLGLFSCSKSGSSDTQTSNDLGKPYWGYASGTYMDYASTNQIIYADSITKGDRSNRIVFRNFGHFGVSVFGDIALDGQALTIQPQTLNSATYWGTGNLTTINNGRQLQAWCYKASGTDTMQFTFILVK